jgi:hypothetical protein
MSLASYFQICSSSVYTTEAETQWVILGGDLAFQASGDE